MAGLNVNILFFRGQVNGQKVDGVKDIVVLNRGLDLYDLSRFKLFVRSHNPAVLKFRPNLNTEN